MSYSFKTFLAEEEKRVYFTFGRMNPPTIGHGKLLEKLATLAGKNQYRVYLSQTQDKKDNPLMYNDKIKIARKMFPRYARRIMLNKKVKTVFDALQTLYDEGFVNIVMVVGSDRVQEFDILIKKYNGKKGRHGLYNFRKIDVVSAGQRDPDARGAEGASATKQRDAARANDFTTFSQGLPRAVNNFDAKKIFNSVRIGLGLSEQKEFKNHVQLESVNETRESYVNGELYKIGDQVIIKETEEIAEVKVRGANYIIVETANGQYRKWLEAIEPMDESLWANIRARRAAGKPKKKPGQKGYPKTLDIEATSSPQDPDIKDRKGTQPKAYHSGIKKVSTKKARDAQFKRQSKMRDDDPSAYKPAPGDATAKTKPSKHTLKFKQMYGEKVNLALAKKRIKREKQIDKIKHDRMMDRARTRDTRAKNREPI